MAELQQLESKLDQVFNKQAPQLPLGVKNFFYKWAPWAALIVGILSLLSAYTLWNGARGVSQSAYYVQQVCSTYQSTNGHCNVPSSVSHLGFWLWLAIVTTIVQGILYLRAFPRLRLFQKSGWNNVYYAALVNVVYAVITLLTGYNVLGHFVGSLIGIAISFYVLFQIRPLYMASTTADTASTYFTQPNDSKPDEPALPTTTPSETIDAAPVTLAESAVAIKAAKPKAKAKTSTAKAKRKPAAQKKLTKKKT